jgi:hypothetical protein
MKRIIWLVLAMAALAGSAGAMPVVTLGLDPPNGFLAGSPGTSVGWGYTLSTGSDYVFIQSFLFEQVAPVGDFSTWNVPVTAAVYEAPIISSWSQDNSGLQYDIWSYSVFGASSQGRISVTYDAYSDPAQENWIGSDYVYAQLDRQDVIAEVYVTPEPGTMILLGAGLAMALLLRRRLA